MDVEAEIEHINERLDELLAISAAHAKMLTLAHPALTQDSAYRKGVAEMLRTYRAQATFYPLNDRALEKYAQLLPKFLVGGRRDP